jgi:ATP-binding cassette, subfamily F, member 3
MPKTRAAKSSTPKKAADDGGIVVTSQQSRFHAEAIDAPSLKDIDIKDLTISIGGLEILDHARLQLQNDTHYVFHGRNGLGKSTVLKALADKLIPGVPSNLRILLLGQTRVSSFSEEDEPGSRGAKQTVLEYVTRSDAVRERALKESKRTYAYAPGDAEL